MTIETPESRIDKARATVKLRHPEIVDLVLATPEDWYAAIQADDSEVHHVHLGVGFRDPVHEVSLDQIRGELQELLKKPFLDIIPYELRKR